MEKPKSIVFRKYSAADREACLDIFDANSPTFFSPNERNDFASFLDASPDGYEVCVVNDEIAGAFGLFGTRRETRSLNWILINPHMQGSGIGTAVINRIVALSRSNGVCTVNTAASHKSAPFFAKFGAETTSVTDNGWGPGMHRVDMELDL